MSMKHLSTMSRTELGYTQGWVSVVINTVLFGFKLWCGMITGSIAMVADAWHTLSDTLTSIVVIIGFRIAAKPPDEKHPFGHGRAEGISAVVIATLLGVVGLDFLIQSAQHLYLGPAKAARFSSYAITVFLISVFIKEALAQFSFWAARRTHSHAIEGDAWHHRSDSIASAMIFVGAFFGKSLWWIDGVMGLGVSALILYAAYEILAGSSRVIMGEGVDKKREEEIIEAVRGLVPDESKIHHLHLHRYGDHVEATLHIKLPSDMNVKRAHEIASTVERAIRERLNIESTVHIEPWDASTNSGSP